MNVRSFFYSNTGEVVKDYGTLEDRLEVCRFCGCEEWGCEDSDCERHNQKNPEQHFIEVTNECKSCCSRSVGSYCIVCQNKLEHETCKK